MSKCTTGTRQSTHQGTHTHRVAALLSEAQILVGQAQRLACRARMSLWRNPSLTALVLDDLNHLQAAALGYVTELDLLLASACATETPTPPRDDPANSEAAA